MQFDSWGLPYIDESDDRSKTLQKLGLYFINLYCHKRLLDEEFRQKHPVRARLESESLDDYDGYITAHNNAYRAMLEKQNLNYMAEADVHLYDKVSSITYGGGLLQIHPVLHPRKMDSINMTPMLCVLLLYGFIDLLKKQEVSVSSLQNERKSPVLRYFSDLWLLTRCYFSDEQNTMAELVVAKDVRPTFISSFANKIFLKRKITAWPSIIKYLGS